MRDEDKESNLQEIRFVEERITIESPTIIIYDEGPWPTDEPSFAEVNSKTGFGDSKDQNLGGTAGGVRYKKI